MYVYISILVSLDSSDTGRLLECLQNEKLEFNSKNQ